GEARGGRQLRIKNFAGYLLLPQSWLHLLRHKKAPPVKGHRTRL
ncbi:MAG: hypothetical protein ACI9FG_001032, partial [Crocinitomicaceae bacterium]